ncbi:hypothetical protein PORCRE_305 [Porphyromonas crevioricanis JCM 15906]|uniref:DUF2851 domain-containing protein n=1 Tax=Porphyromonas crevioricanis JCM 15906 TaxID=1305617 RepID=T1DQ91_9PORP|nr:DUF2851 family protein [Porphyromonas crevioricanis]GAD04615.1 hypothetical protein PORCRE_305 [Porphyromonas crevioricanis JCM 15906]SJZ67917.1 Protein of unknown function [Porphyromonas crevioricanis]
MEEKLLHYAFRYRLYDSLVYVNGTEAGQAVSVLSPGELNIDAGPDFFNASIKIGEAEMVGCVEIHKKSSDWYTHKHDRDPAYDNVILHIVLQDDVPVYHANGSPLPTARISIPGAMQRLAGELLSRSKSPACIAEKDRIQEGEWQHWLLQLAGERLDRKAEQISQMLLPLQTDWNELTYILLARYLGGNVNAEAFEQLARHLPYSYIRKQRGQLLQIEAMLYGIAGLIPDPSTLGEADEDTIRYVEQLDREYCFLAHKYGLSPLPAGCIRMLRIRPAAFPTIRIAQFAALLHKHEFLFSRLMSASCVEEAEAVFDQVRVSPYWLTHYSFSTTRPEIKEQGISRNTRQLIIANVLCPLLSAYGHIRKDNSYRERAKRLLEQMPAEQNRYTRFFVPSVVKPTNMLQSQGLIQLYKVYCSASRCLSCHIGYCLLSNTALS